MTNTLPTSVWGVFKARSTELAKGNSGAALAVGGLLDFVSERIPRAPVWMQKLGIEWCYRLYQEPRRMFRRYVLGNPLFILRVIFRKD